MTFVWTKEEALRLAQEYASREHLIRAELTPKFTWKNKQKIWQDIVEILNR